jgi:hypothetical protein
MQTKEKELLNWIKEKKIVTSHEIMQKGLDMFYIRADRTKRDFQKAGFIRKLTEFEKIMAGYRCKDAVYEVNNG